MADGQVDVKIITADAVQSLNDLKQVIKDAKKNLAELEIGDEKYQAQLKALIDAQNLLRGAMNGTTATMTTLQHEVDGTSKSYNALVNQMADLKRQFRSTTDEVQRANLGGQIREINEELKRMDAMKGDFQRNVGDYFNQTSAAMKDVIKDLPSGLDKIKGPLRDIEGTMGLMSKHPIIGIIGLLSPIIVEIVNGLKENDAALAGVKKGMDALKPVMDFFSGILDTIVNYLGDIISKAADFLSSSGIFNQVIKGVMGVGNAILKFVVAPFKGVAAAIKVFKEEGVKGIRNAAIAFTDEMQNGFSFKENYKSGQIFADTIIAGAKSRKPKIRETGKEVAKELGEGLMEGLDTILDRVNAKWEKQMDEREKRHKQRQADIEAYNKEQAERFAEEQEAEAEQAAETWAKEVEDAKEAARQKLEAMQGYAAGTSSLLNGIADMMEAEGKSAKNIRIAGATIDMISGAVAAFSSAHSIPPPAGPIIGAINAAAVVASGLANIAKIRSTTVSKGSAPSQAAPQTAATVSAPALETAVPTTTVVNGASTEAALNRAAQPQKVYILQSDIEAANNASQVQVAEASF